MKLSTARPRRRGVGLLLATAALATAGGIAYASIPGPDGVIHGCRHKQSGALRVIDSAASCNSSTEIALDWNQAGAPASTTAYSDYNEFMAVGADDVAVVSVEVPAGSYTVAAKTHAYSTSNDSWFICNLVAAGDVIDGNVNRLIAPANDQVVPFLGVASLPEGGTIELVCDNNNTEAFTVSTDNTSLVATQVGELR